MLAIRSIELNLWKLFLYRDIKSVLLILARAGRAKGLETVVETWVSVLENHASSHCNLGQNRLVGEGMVAINGPEVVYCATVVRGALKVYWGKARKAK